MYSIGHVCGMCGGKLSFYDGALGYESLVCAVCGHDSQDYPQSVTPQEFYADELEENLKEVLEVIKTISGLGLFSKAVRILVKVKSLEKNLVNPHPVIVKRKQLKRYGAYIKEIVENGNKEAIMLFDDFVAWDKLPKIKS